LWWEEASIIFRRVIVWIDILTAFVIPLYYRLPWVRQKGTDKNDDENAYSKLIQKKIRTRRTLPLYGFLLMRVMITTTLTDASDNEKKVESKKSIVNIRTTTVTALFLSTVAYIVSSLPIDFHL
jgi:hypothetical protein